MVVEIPKMTKKKMEIATKQKHNPIAQDLKNGHLREYAGPIFWNYGCLPQTWEDPTEKHPDLKVFGDNDPVDVVEIGSRSRLPAEVLPVKILGALALIDKDELDWKIIAIAADDKMAPELNDISDVDAKMPWLLPGIREWFRWYKTPDGDASDSESRLNAFGYGEKALGRQQAMNVVAETHEAWKRLRSGSVSSPLWVDTK